MVSRSSASTFKVLGREGKRFIDKAQKGHCLRCPTVLNLDDAVYYVPSRSHCGPRWYCGPCGAFMTGKKIQVKTMHKSHGPNDWIFNHFCSDCKKHLAGICGIAHRLYNWCDGGDWGKGSKTAVHCSHCYRKTIRPYVLDDEKYCKRCIPIVMKTRLRLTILPQQVKPVIVMEIPMMIGTSPTRPHWGV